MQTYNVRITWPTLTTTIEADNASMALRQAIKSLAEYEAEKGRFEPTFDIIEPVEQAQDYWLNH